MMHLTPNIKCSFVVVCALRMKKRTNIDERKRNRHILHITAMSRCVTLNQFCRPFAAFAPLGCILHWQTLAISEIELVGICGAGFCVWMVSGCGENDTKVEKKNYERKTHLAKCIFCCCLALSLSVMSLQAVTEREKI